MYAYARIVSVFMQLFSLTPLSPGKNAMGWQSADFIVSTPSTPCIPSTPSTPCTPRTPMVHLVHLAHIALKLQHSRGLTTKFIIFLIYRTQSYGSPLQISELRQRSFNFGCSFYFFCFKTWHFLLKWQSKFV